jgi:cell wall-associated NlpC family hydrolase
MEADALGDPLPKDRAHVVVVPQAADRYMGTWLPAPGLRTEPLAAARRKASGEAIAEAALMFLGTPYEWGGLTSEGIDCSGLVQTVHRRFGMLLPRNSDQQEQAGREVSLRSVQPGDLLCYGDHVAVALEGGEIVHAVKEQGAVVREKHPADLKKRVRTVRRVFDAED